MSYQRQRLGRLMRLSLDHQQSTLTGGGAVAPSIIATLAAAGREPSHWQEFYDVVDAAGDESQRSAECWTEVVVDRDQQRRLARPLFATTIRDGNIRT